MGICGCYIHIHRKAHAFFTFHLRKRQQQSKCTFVNFFLILKNNVLFIILIDWQLNINFSYDIKNNNSNNNNKNDNYKYNKNNSSNNRRSTKKLFSFLILYIFEYVVVVMTQWQICICIHLRLFVTCSISNINLSMCGIRRSQPKYVIEGSNRGVLYLLAYTSVNARFSSWVLTSKQLL